MPSWPTPRRRVDGGQQPDLLDAEAGRPRSTEGGRGAPYACSRWRWAAEPARSSAAALVTALAAIGAPRGLTARQVALAWLTRIASVRPIVGARTPAEATALAHPASLSEAELSAFESAASTLAARI